MSTSVDLAYTIHGSLACSEQSGEPGAQPRHTPVRHDLAIDFVPVTETGRTAPITLSSLLKPEPVEGFSGFGRPILVLLTALSWRCMIASRTIMLITDCPRFVTR